METARLRLQHPISPSFPTQTIYMCVCTSIYIVHVCITIRCISPLQLTLSRIKNPILRNLVYALTLNSSLCATPSLVSGAEGPPSSVSYVLYIIHIKWRKTRKSLVPSWTFNQPTSNSYFLLVCVRHKIIETLGSFFFFSFKCVNCNYCTSLMMDT